MNDLDSQERIAWIGLYGAIISAIAPIIVSIVIFYLNRSEKKQEGEQRTKEEKARSKHEETKLAIFNNESVERGKWEKSADNFEALCLKYERDKKKCEREKKKIDNRNWQLNIVLGWYDLLKIDRESLLVDKDISVPDWEEREETKKIRDKIREKQKKCANCDECAEFNKSGIELLG